MLLDANKQSLPTLFVRLQRIRLARLAMRISNLFADLAEVFMPEVIRR